MEATQTVNRAIYVRQCVACGYDGALLRGGQADYCARCGCDLAERPARSYAEMEGLLGQALPEQPDAMAPLRARVIPRWILFLFLAMVGLLSLVGFVDAALP